MEHRDVIIVILLIGLGVNCQMDNSVTKESKRVLRCPSVNARNCLSSKPNQSTSCVTDNDCVTLGDVCCPDQCDRQRRICLPPVLTACEHQRLSSEKRARALLSEPSSSSAVDVGILSCKPDGRFEPIQCNSSGHCWCVDESGFEIGGTRVKSRESVNCAVPRPCAGHLCRMLCPYDFELDTDGCPMCRCRDPCHGVQCPRGTQCQLEEVTCEQQPCPPVSTCKQPRSLDDVCPIGKALTVSDTDKVFLCGLETTKPQCPMYFACEIQPNMDYGVCCPSTDRLTKPGTCPVNVTNCDGRFNCKHDMECEGLDKCCHVDGCGHVCVPMAENTRCLQQKILSELLSVHEKSGHGYIPQCTATGQFERRQCSRNGLVCWCVDVNGFKLPRSMGPAQQVLCPQDIQVSPRDCQHITCSNQCPYGFKEDDDGCPNCQCVNPCDSIKCPAGMECAMVASDICADENDESSCDTDTYPICKPPPILYTKPGNCPLPSSSIQCTNTSCQHDRHCPNDLKCCQHPSCPTAQCVAPIRTSSQRLPTMCEYLRDFRSNAVDGSRALQVALPAPTCRPDGGYQPLQCHRGQCWCVDEFGTELSGSRTAEDEKRDCETAVRNKGCDGLLCRLGCDYGFRYGEEDGCPVCDCRSPCDGVRCGHGEECQLIEVDCFGGFCPSVPQCLSTKSSMVICPVGEPLRHSLTNATRSCAAGSACPTGYFCSSTDTNTSEGVCCKKTVKAGQCPYRFPLRLGHCEGQSECDSDHHCPGAKKCCSDGCIATCIEPEIKTGCEHRAAVGQYMLDRKSLVLGHIHLPKCEDDDGSYSPVQCDISPATGRRYCWCADDHGRELPGTRRGVTTEDELNDMSNCTTDNGKCPNVSLICQLRRCEHGFKLDSAGCNTCECHDPCEDLLCSKKEEECQLVGLRCVTQPCPTVPMCVPKASNPCPYGEPLDNGPRCSSLPNGITCPSTHMCVHSPLDHFPSTCCPKPREICFKDHQQHHQPCPTSSPKPHRWYFHVGRNRCELSPNDKCSISINGFADRVSCESVCPPLSDCERAREKAKQLAKKNSGFGFVPKCKRDGSWEVTQCLAQLGLCWCVTSAGEYVKGTAVRGLPRCIAGVATWRMGRKLDPNQTDLIKSPYDVTGLACPDGAAVHFCNASLCEGKVCLSRPDATCRVNPCGGCHFRFYVDDQLIDCEQGLSGCQKEVQDVLNSQLWKNVLRGQLQQQQQLQPQHMMDVSMMVLPPRCAADGRYEPVQSQGELQWCVTAEGEPVHTSLTRGNVSCDNNGVVDRWPRGPTCANPNNRPMVCRYECHNLTCPSHPDAICTADPCDSCRVTFVTPSGDLVHCQDKCLQPVEHGMCRAAFPRWHHNVTSASCEPFVYGGCLGNDNNFETKQQCEEQCSSNNKKEVSVCEQDKRIGSCRASMKRWWFDRVTQQCQQFIYGGCDGNGNNFETKQQCESTCPDVVLCPRLDLLRSTPVACVRSVLCFNRTCPLQPEAYCTVEPCDCSVRFVHFDGKVVESCRNQTTASSTVATITTMSAEPFTTTEEPKTKVSRCEQLRAIALATASQSIPECDHKGAFQTTQCDHNQHCWCVDEAGNRLDPADNTFQRGTRSCPVTIVDSVSVTLVFPNRDVLRLGEVVVTKAMMRWLTQLLPSVTVDNVTVSLTADDVRVDISLSGDDSIEAGFLLQEKVTTEGEVTLSLESGRTVELRGGSSTVEHHLAGVSEFDDQPDDVTSFISTTTLIVLAVIGSAVAVLAIFLLIYILLQRRRSSGYFPQSSGGSVCSLDSKPLPQPPAHVAAFWSIPDSIAQHTSTQLLSVEAALKREDEHVYEQLRYNHN